MLPEISKIYNHWCVSLKLHSDDLKKLVFYYIKVLNQYPKQEIPFLASHRFSLY